MQGVIELCLTYVIFADCAFFRFSLSLSLLKCDKVPCYSLRCSTNQLGNYKQLQDNCEIRFCVTA